MELVLPSVEYKASYIEAVKEFHAAKDALPMARHYVGLSIPELETDFENHVEKMKSQSRGENLPQGWVPMTTYWLVDNNEYIGGIAIRHTLNENLKNYGGHIGYDIRPSMRGKGYGSKILELGLQKAKEFHISRILIDCGANNTASRKIIEKNRGIYEGAGVNPETGEPSLRFWIENK